MKARVTVQTMAAGPLHIALIMARDTPEPDLDTAFLVVQRFLSIDDQFANVFTRRPDQDTAAKFQSARNQAFTNWAEITVVAMAAQSCLLAALSRLTPSFVSQPPTT
jgi:hypothetical protein